MWHTQFFWCTPRVSFLATLLIYIYIYTHTHTHTYGQLMYRCVLLVWRKNVKKTKRNTYLVCMLLKKFCFIEGSWKHVVSVTLNGRSWTTRTLPKAGLLAKLSNWWRRALVRGVTKNLIVTLVELHDCINVDGRNLQKDKHHCNAPSIWALRRCGQTQPSLQCRHMKTHLELAKKAPKWPSDCEK